MGVKTRAFVVTQWNLEANYAEIMAKNNIRFIAYGEETCPETGRKHHQTYMYLHEKRNTGVKTLKKMGDWWGEKHCYVAAMRGSFTQNEDYCEKEGDLVKIGDEPTQGARGDLAECKNAILAGELSVDDICVEDPETFHQYGRTLERLEAIALRRKWRTEMTEGIWYHGPTAAGKSHKAFHDYDPSTHYVKNLQEDWWDGYKGQETVILNEFRGQVTFSELLDLADKWPKNVKWKCKESVPFLAKRIIVTSVLTPEQVYKNKEDEDDWGQFHRRFKTVELKKRSLDQMLN